MIDVDELLTERGAAWEPPAVGDPDLERALARSAARRNAVISGTLVAVVAVAVTGAAVVLARPAPLPAAPGPVASDTSVASPPEMGIQVSVLEVEDATRKLAARFGVAASAEAVLAPWEQVRPRLRVQPAKAPSAEALVWLVAVRGEFNCDNCITSAQGPEAGSGTLTVVFDAGSMRSVHVEGSDEAVDLRNLGTVSELRISG